MSVRQDLRRLRLRTAGPYAVLAAALAFTAWCTLSASSRPGLQYDEALFVNAALGGDYSYGVFVSSQFHGVPTMVMPYIGALKSWLYVPVFEVFGVSVDSIRLPAIAALLASVGLTFALGRRLFGAWPAALLVVLVATDPAYMVLSKVDLGPVAISGLLRIGALTAYFAWLRTDSARYLWLLVAILALGVFNKLDYLAFIGGLAVAAALIHGPEILERIRRRPWDLALPMVALAAALAIEYVEIYVPASELPLPESNAGFPERLSEIWTLYRVTMDGSGIYQYMTTLTLDHRTAITAATVIMCALAAGLAIWGLARARSRSRSRPADPPEPDSLEAAAGTTGFFLVLFAVMAIELTATPQVNGPHHILLLWPLPALLAVSLVSAASRLRARPDIRIAATAILTLGLVWLAGTQIRTATEYRSASVDDRAWAAVFTPEIYPLQTAMREAAPASDAIVVADWGIGNQLLALGDEGVRSRLFDHWSTFASGTPASVEGFARVSLEGRRVIVVFHTPSGEQMPGSTRLAQGMIEGFAPARGVQTIYRGQVLQAYALDDRDSGVSRPLR